MEISVPEGSSLMLIKIARHAAAAAVWRIRKQTHGYTSMWHKIIEPELKTTMSALFNNR
jgi:hypothetical protein